jgi:hypothetical protein
VILKRLDHGGDGDTLTVLVDVPDAKSNGEAATKAVEAAETLASRTWRGLARDATRRVGVRRF